MVEKKECACVNGCGKEKGWTLGDAWFCKGLAASLQQPECVPVVLNDLLSCPCCGGH